MTNLSTGLLVAAVALLDERGQVLMQQRAQDSMHGGLWEFPGGKRENGETTRQTAVREIAEELGLTIAVSDLEPVAFADAAQEDSSPGEIVILLYTCRRWQGVAECRGGEAIAWFDPGELSMLAMPPLDYPLAERLKALLAPRGE